MISNRQDIIDSRDIIDELNELEGDLECYIDDEGGTEEDFPAIDRLNELREWNELGDDIDDWDYGAMLIHYDYFSEYAKELVKDIGDLPKDLPWYIESNIDWDGVADDLMSDYTSIELGGQTYLVR